MSSLSIVILGILDNFGKGGVKEWFYRYRISIKQDTFWYHFLYIEYFYCLLYFQKKVSDFEILTLSLLTVFGIQLNFWFNYSIVFNLSYI